MGKRILAWGLAAGLLIGGCGGGEGLGDPASGALEGGTAPPSERATPPAAQAIKGTWTETVSVSAPTVLAVSADGWTYGLLNNDQDTDIVRGRLMSLEGQVQSSPFDAVSLRTGRARQIGFSGSHPSTQALSLNLVPGGAPVAIAYDARYDTPVPLVDLKGSHTALVTSGNVSDAAVLTLDDHGAMQWTSMAPDWAHCQATGALTERAQSPAYLDAVLDFSGEGCQLPAGTRIRGFALVDPGAQQISIYGMDEAGTLGLFVHATRR